MTKHKIYTMSVARVYPLYVTKAEKKGRTKAEIDEVIRWLTGYSQEELEVQLEKKIDFETFFAEAPQMNPSRTLIKGVICRSEEHTSELQSRGQLVCRLLLAKKKKS